MATKKQRRPQVNPVSDRFTPIQGAMQYKQTPAERIKELERQLRESNERTPMEQLGSALMNDVQSIGDTRAEIKHLEAQLETQRAYLQRLLLHHADLNAKIVSLGTIPQPA